MTNPADGAGRMRRSGTVMIDARRHHQRRAKRHLPVTKRRVQRAATDLDNTADQRIAVGMYTRRWQRYGDITGRWQIRRQQRAAFGCTNSKAGQVETASQIDTRHLGCFAANQRAFAINTAIRNARNNIGSNFGIKLSCCEIIKEKQRNSTLCHDVIDAHCHQINAKPAIIANRARQLQLCADPVGGSDKDRVFKSCGAQIKQPAKAAKGAICSGPACACGMWSNGAHKGVTGIDIHPGITIAEGL